MSICHCYETREGLNVTVLFTIAVNSLSSYRYETREGLNVTVPFSAVSLTGISFTGYETREGLNVTVRIPNIASEMSRLTNVMKQEKDLMSRYCKRCKRISRERYGVMKQEKDLMSRYSTSLSCHNITCRL